MLGEATVFYARVQKQKFTGEGYPFSSLETFYARQY
jgi:hypothetical protein